MPEKVRFTFLISQEQREWLEREAERRSITATEVMRDALRLYATTPEPKRDPFASIDATMPDFPMCAEAGR